MKTGQGFLLVFSITSLSSLNELSEIRDQIMRIKDDPSVPIVLVGNKCDLEEDRAVSRGRAFAVSQSWGNAPYYETSARRRANVDESFRDLCRQIIRRDQEATRAQGHQLNDDRRHRDRHRDSHSKGGKGRGGRRPKRTGPCTIL
jgi:Ras-related protein Rap-1B